jgi:hypothetical protein
MTDEEIKDLESSEEWDFSDVEPLEDANEPGAIFAVKVTDTELWAITESAKKLGIPVAQFLRDAILEKVTAFKSAKPPPERAVDARVPSRRRARALKKPA